MKLAKIIPLVILIGGLCSCSPSDGPTSSSVATSISQDPNLKSEIYVSPNGLATNQGTKESPLDIINAFKNLKQGGKIILLEGTYSLSSTVQVTRDDERLKGCLATSEEEMKLVEPERDSQGNYVDVTLDFSRMAWASTNRGVSLDSDYWHIKGFKVVGAGDNGVYIGGNYNIVEDIEAYDNRDTGIQLGRSASNMNDISEWPSYNTILNCTSHDNHDPTGEDSDGFACKLTTGVGNVFDGCIAYNNVDDGWDLYTKGDSGPIGSVLIKDCIAFNNGITSYGVGTSNSDGNGFKLGGETIAVQHKIINSIAFNNMASGFTDNSNPGTLYFENCTAFNNGTRDSDGLNFSTCRDTATTINFYKNCLSYSTGDVTNPITGQVHIANSKDEYKGTVSHSAFYNSLSNLYIGEIQEADYSVSNLRGENMEVSNPFVSVDVLQIQSLKDQPIDESKRVDVHHEFRNSDGSINIGDFLKVKSDSPFYTLGENNSPLGANLSK